MTKKQSIEDIQNELATLQPKQTSSGSEIKAQPTDTHSMPYTSATPDCDAPDYCENFIKWPMTADEKKEFDKELAIASRNRHALSGDPDPDHPEEWLRMERLLKRFGI